jgi:hypothetical protein
MRHALERIDVSENVARRKRFEFVTLAGVACGLIGCGYGAFAPIRNRSCGACKMTIASQQLQRAKRGVFITCANCARFVYIAAVE